MLRSCLPVAGGIWRQFPDHKFLQNVGRRRFADSDQRIFEGESDAVAIACRIIEIGNAARGQSAQNSRIIRLPFSLVALANDGIRDGIKYSRLLASRPFVEISRILFEKRRQNRAADKSAGCQIRVRRTVAFSVAFRALSIAAEVVLRLL